MDTSTLFGWVLCSLSDPPPTLPSIAVAVDKLSSWLIFEELYVLRMLTYQYELHFELLNAVYLSNIQFGLIKCSVLGNVFLSTP